MIFRKQRLIDGSEMNLHMPGIIGIQDVGDKTIISHAQNVERIQEEVKYAKLDTDKGWTKKRNMKLIGRIPMLVYIQHPEFATDDKAIERWLATEEGAPYKIGT